MTESVREFQTFLACVYVRVVVFDVFSAAQFVKSFCGKCENQNASYYYPYNHNQKGVKVNIRSIINRNIYCFFKKDKQSTFFNIMSFFIKRQ